MVVNWCFRHFGGSVFIGSEELTLPKTLSFKLNRPCTWMKRNLTPKVMASTPNANTAHGWEHLIIVKSSVNQEWTTLLNTSWWEILKKDPSVTHCSSKPHGCYQNRDHWHWSWRAWTQALYFSRASPTTMLTWQTAQQRNMPSKQMRERKAPLGIGLISMPANLALGCLNIFCKTFLSFILVVAH